MNYMGIDRGDGRSPEQKAAAENITTAWGMFGCTVFLCRECGEKGDTPLGEYGIRHMTGCKTGKILEES
jgi:hypothetical protein